MKPEEIINDISEGKVKRLKAALEYLWLVQEYPLFNFNLIDVTLIANKYGREADLAYDVQTKENKQVGHFALSFLPGCEECVLVSHAVSIAEVFKGQGIASALNRFKQQAAGLVNIQVLLATVLAENQAERSVLQKNKWDDVLSFHSDYGTDIVLVVKEL